MSSGLRTIPLMAGLLVTAVLSGRAISRIGRYRPFPIAGTAILVVGMFLSRCSASTRRRGSHRRTWSSSASGSASSCRCSCLAVQNDARPEEIGVATASATFFRTVGGAFGVALFGTIFASRLSDQLAGLPHAVTAHLGSGVQLNPQQIDQLPSAVHDVACTRSPTRSAVCSSSGWRCRSCRSRSRGSSRRSRSGRRSRARRRIRSIHPLSSVRVALEPTQRRTGGVVAAHPVHAAPGRRRSGAEEHAPQRRRVRRDPGHGTREELEKVAAPPLMSPPT